LFRHRLRVGWLSLASLFPSIARSARFSLCIYSAPPFASVFSDCAEAVWIDLKRTRCVRSFSLSLSTSSTLLSVGWSYIVIVFLIWKGLYLGFHDWLVGIFSPLGFVTTSILHRNLQACSNPRLKFILWPDVGSTAIYVVRRYLFLMSFVPSCSALTQPMCWLRFSLKRGAIVRRGKLAIFNRTRATWIMDSCFFAVLSASGTFHLQPFLVCLPLYTNTFEYHYVWFQQVWL
jgi:hypothetical protein